jgi:hypothetical protein
LLAYQLRTPAPSTAHRASSDDDIALVRRLPPGALLDPPLAVGRAAQLRNGDYLLLNSYSPRPTAACCNSFVSPIRAQVVDLAAQLPDPRAVEALHARLSQPACSQDGFRPTSSAT